MIACFLSLHTDFYLERTACFIYFFASKLAQCCRQGPVVGFFREVGGKSAREKQLVSNLTKAIKCTFSISEYLL